MDPNASFEVASRTDRGVSAVGNALSLSSDLPGPALLRALNGASPRIFVTAARPVSPTFRVRRAVAREYRYFGTAPFARPDRVADAAALFQGPVDVRSFGRAVPVTEPAWRTVGSVRVVAEEAGPVIIVRAPSFVWGMVRKVVASLREVDAGRLPLARLHQAITGRARLTVPIAEPEPLVLWDVDFAQDWSFHWAGPNRRQGGWWLQARRESAARNRVLAVLPPSGRPTAG